MTYDYIVISMHSMFLQCKPMRLSSSFLRSVSVMLKISKVLLKVESIYDVIQVEASATSDVKVIKLLGFFFLLIF